MQKNPLAGYAVNLLMLSYLTMAAAVVLRSSLAMGLLYLGIIPLGFLAIAYTWCGTCTCRHDCTHLWLGPLSRRLPQRKPGPYTIGERVGIALYLAGLHLFPLYWLWRHKVLLVLFGVLALATFLIGPLYSCKHCGNEHCPLRQ